MTSYSEQFKYGANCKVIGKCDPQKLSYPGAWQQHTTDFAGLAEHISQGHPWMPALLDGDRKRLQNNANRAEVLALDIDGGMAIAESLRHPFIKAYCGLGIESSSSSPELEKFRLVFRSPKAIEGWELIRICNRYLASIIEAADPACKDASRFFFGGLGRKAFLLNKGAVLPESFIDDAIAWDAEQQRQAELAATEQRRKWERYREENPVDSSDTIAAALDYIPPYSPGEGRYPELIPVLGGVLNELGPEGERRLYQWDGGRGDWGRGGFTRIIESLKRSRPARAATIGSLFYLAKQYGFKFPQRQRERFTLQDVLQKLRGGKSKPKLKPKPAAAASTAADVEYAPGERLETWKRAMADGYQFVLEASSTGLGKSWDSGNAEPSEFDVKRVHYLSPEHRNPSTQTLDNRNGWVDLEARHNGLAVDEQGKLRRVKAREQYTVHPNCNRTGLINALRAKNISGADTAAVVCGGCPLREACQHASGPHYGFLSQRRDALSSPKMRSHPDSLSSPEDFDYSETLNLWDETDETFTISRQIEVFKHDVEATISHLITNNSALFQQLYLLIMWLLNALSGEVKLGRYGLGHDAVQQQLPPLESIDLEQLAAALSPARALDEVLNPVGEHGVDISDMPKSVRERFVTRDHEAATEADQKLPKQWLLDLVQVATGVTRGHLHIDKHKLTITLPDTRHRAIAHNSKATVFMSATLTRQQLAAKLNCSPADICVVRQRDQDHGNLKLIQVKDLGRLGMQRGADQERRAAALVAHYQQQPGKTAVIDFKKFGADGAWWRDSRGVNDFQDCDRLILVGTPCRNIAALEAEYHILSGQSPHDDDGEHTPAFTTYVDAIIQADFTQGIGRIRAHQRPNAQLEVIILSDFELSAPTEEVRASDICPEAGTKRERVERAIRDAVRQLRAMGQRVTQTAIAKLVGVSQGYVNRFRELLQTLLEPPNSKSNSPPEGLEPVMEAAFRNSAGPSDEAEILGELLDWLPPPQISALFERLNPETQHRILTTLALFGLSEGELLKVSGCCG